MARRFDRVLRFLPGEMVQAGREVLDILFSAVPAYPPPPLGSRYVRTFNLQDALTSTRDTHAMSLSEVRRLSDGVEVVYGVSGYGPHVVGPGVQAWMHRGRWWTLLDVLRRARKRIPDKFHKGKERAFRRAGIGIRGR